MRTTNSSLLLLLLLLDAALAAAAAALVVRFASAYDELVLFIWLLCIVLALIQVVVVVMEVAAPGTTLTESSAHKWQATKEAVERTPHWAAARAASPDTQNLAGFNQQDLNRKQSSGLPPLLDVLCLSRATRS